MTNFATLLERLLSVPSVNQDVTRGGDTLLNTPEGPGSALDNCAILGFTDVDEGQSHNYQQNSPGTGIPMIVAGRAGGRLVHPGIHYRIRRLLDRTAFRGRRYLGGASLVA
jgi:hypothetical protein